MKFKIDTTGAEKKINNFSVFYGKNGIVAIGENQRDFVYKYIAKRIFDLSQIYVPVDTGNLKSTGKIVKNSIGTYSIVYTAPYAKFVHEIVDNWHKYPTRSKFLEDAGYEILNEFESIGLSFGFTFSMETEDDVVLHLDSLSLEDFNFNRHYGDYADANFLRWLMFGESKELEGIRRPESEVLY